MIIFILIILCLVILAIYNDTKKPKNFPNGPSWLPVIGNLNIYKKLLGSLGFHHLVWCELSKKYGNVVGLKLGRNIVVCVLGPDAIKEVMTREEFDGRPDGYLFRLRTFGKRLGIVFSDGELWQKQRKFSVNHLRHFGFGKKDMDMKIEVETKDLIDVFRKQCDKPIEMQTAFDISVLNVLWSMMAGNRFSLDDIRLQTLVNCIHHTFTLLDISGGILNQMPVLRHFAPDKTGFNDVVYGIEKLMVFLREVVDEHKSTLCSSHSRDLIDSFITKMDQPQKHESFTDEQLLSLCLDLLMAGSETTSNTLAFAILYMVKYPEIQKRVQDEIHEAVGVNRWPVYEDRIRMPYTEAVLMEVQRIANVPPLGIAHRAIRDTHLQGRRIPKDTIILPCLYSIHMDKDFWKDPETFRPERFIGEEGKIVIPEKYFAPFGYGKRRCLGEALAKSNLFSFFSAILYNFDIQKDPEHPEIDMIGRDGVTIAPKPYRVVLHPRADY